MPVAVRRLSDPEINLVTFSGEVGGEDLAALAHAACGGGVFGRPTLVWVRGGVRAEGLPLTRIADLRRAMVAAGRREGGPRARTALVFEGGGHPLLELWAAFAAGHADYPNEPRAFRDLAAAGEWIGLDGEQLARVGAEL